MKIAVTGKGGVGKSTIAAMLARNFAEKGRTVIAVDADPDANLARCLGLSEEQIARLTPLSEMKELIAERTGTAGSSGYGVFFKMNPKVDDIPERFSVHHEGVRLLQLGSTKRGGSGCYCPENALLRQLIGHLLIQRDELVILDMEAGFEHLTRGTARSVDVMLVVVEPGRLSIETAQRIRPLANDLGIRSVAVVANKIRTDSQKETIRSSLRDFEVLAFLPFDEKLIEADLRGISAYDIDSPFKAEISRLADRMLLRRTT